MQSAASIVSLLQSRHCTISCCESFTAGLFAASLGSVPGVSAVFPGGLVTYSAAIKEQLAHVSPQLIEQYGVVSEECAKAMAENTRELFKTDLCVSFTGNAGPDALEGKPAGLVYIAIADKDGIQVYERRYDLERNALRNAAVSFSLEKLGQILQETA